MPRITVPEGADPLLHVWTGTDSEGAAPVHTCSSGSAPSGTVIRGIPSR
ncbi:MAG: hypothetical protein ACKOIA_04150 [Acidimicrobiia bacterium]